MKLNNKINIPQIGLGLWKVKSESELQTAVSAALDSGYTHFDSAQIYGNEKMLGKALKIAGTKRSELFITTKIWNDNQWEDDLADSLEQSLEFLQTDYVNLLLIHFPVTQTRSMAWKGLELAYKQGKASTIGVSNYTVKHLEELLKECTIKPMVNQVELHVFLQQPELVEFCKKHGILIEAYSPLAHGYGFDDPVLISVAEKHSKTVQQIMLRWCIEIGVVPLPKSTNPDRIKQNAEIFDFKLDTDDIKQIKGLDKNHRTCWDPTNIS